MENFPFPEIHRRVPLSHGQGTYVVDIVPAGKLTVEEQDIIYQVTCAEPMERYERVRVSLKIEHPSTSPDIVIVSDLPRVFRNNALAMPWWSIYIPGKSSPSDGSYRITIQRELGKFIVYVSRYKGRDFGGMKNIYE